MVDYSLLFFSILYTTTIYSDFGYNADPLSKSQISTPFIDKLAKEGIQLKNYYTHSLCTPSRAALMTGKYAFNVGLNSVLVPGTPGGLSSDYPTLPSILKEFGGYNTAMAGT